MIRNKIKKLYKTIKTFFSNPKDTIIFLSMIVITIVLIIPVPYTVTVGGGTMNINKKITIEGSIKNKGSYSLAYVRELKGTVISYLLGKIVPSYELNKLEDITLDNETTDEYNYREKKYFSNSLNNAIKVAYETANKNISVISTTLNILYVDEFANTNLQTGDIILKLNDIEIKDYEQFSNLLYSYINEEKVTITVKRKNKEITCNASFVEIDSSKKLGIYLVTEHEYQTDPKIDVSFSNKEVGPSGGLMIALEIYDKLVNEDITKGRKIVGTGTIDEEGNIGEIGGVSYKLKGAVKANADIFLIPKNNYEEALAIKVKNNYNIKLLGVSTFDEALELLK